MGALPKYEPIPPGDGPDGPAARPATGLSPPGPVLLSHLEPEPPADFDLAPNPARRARILPLRPADVGRETAPVSPRISRSFRDLLIAAAIAIGLAICLALILGLGLGLGRVAPQPANLKPIPAARSVPQTSVQTDVQPSAAHPAKPSAYGEAFLPPKATRRTHPTAPAPAKPGN